MTPAQRQALRAAAQAQLNQLAADEGVAETITAAAPQLPAGSTPPLPQPQPVSTATQAPLTNNRTTLGQFQDPRPNTQPSLAATLKSVAKAMLGIKSK